MEHGWILGFPIHIGSPETLMGQVLYRVEQGQSVHVVTLNPEMLMQGQTEPALGDVLKAADVILPDGAGAVWALKRQGHAVKRVPGIEFSERLLAHAAQHQEPVALVGASQEVIDAVAHQLRQKFPGLQINFTHHGFFQSEEERRSVAQACADAKPRFVFVALGVPRQEFWIRDFRPIFDSPTVFVGVGGSFDVWSGLKKRAHPLFLKYNLEWLWRITSEPWRLKRVSKTLPLFVVKVLLHREHSTHPS